MLSQSPERWIEWVRCVCVMDGRLPEDEAEDGATPILLSYYRRTGSYPWQQPAPDIPLLRTLCHDYANAFWRKQKRRDRLLERWMPLSSDGHRGVEAMAIDELCAQEFLDSLPPRLRELLHYRLQGDTCAQIAERLGVSAGTVQAYLRDPTFAVTLDADAILTGPNRYLYMECGATLYLTVDVTTKFVTIGPDTWKKGANPQGNPIPVLNTPDEGDTAVRLTYNLWRLQWEWTTDITHQLDFKPSLDAWHSSYYCPGPGAPPFLTNPDILWSAVGAHNVDIDDAIPTSARVMQNYGAYIPYNMPSLSDYSLRVRVTDNTDGFTDIAEKKIRVHFPIEEWQQLGMSHHPITEWVKLGIPDSSCPTKVALGMSPSSDWVFYGAVPGPATFQRAESQQVSLTVTGAIQLQPGVTIGSDIVKLAFQVNTGVTLGVTPTQASSITYTWQVPAGEVWYFYWGYSHRILWGLCDIYDQEGYAGTFEWNLLEWGRDPSGVVPIVWTYYIVR